MGNSAVHDLSDISTISNHSTDNSKAIAESTYDIEKS